MRTKRTRGAPFALALTLILALAALGLLPGGTPMASAANPYIYYNNDGNGTVSGPSNTAAGNSVTPTVTPKTEYELDALTVTDANNAPVTVFDNKSFTMPDSNVTVRATIHNQREIRLSR